MDGIINELEDEYTSGKCIELACALSRKYHLKIAAYIFLEDDNYNVLTLENMNQIPDIPKEQQGNLFIDHVYATDGKNYYDFYGKTENPQYMCEHQSILIHDLSENDILTLTRLSKKELDERVKKAEKDVINMFPERFEGLKKERNYKRNRL